MLGQICAYLRNWFTRDQKKLLGTFTITNENTVLFMDVVDVTEDFQAGQYVRIVGSTFNDGVWRWGSDELEPETFTGGIYGMAVPKEVLQLAEDIEAWATKYQDALNSPYTSESFGGYSYTRASGNANTGGSVATWQDIFASRLAPWRKI